MKCRVHGWAAGRFLNDRRAFAAAARVLGVTEVDVRSMEQHPTMFAYKVRLWNRRRLLVADYELMRVL